MAELTQLESKLAEVIGLAQAAQDSTSAVAQLVEDEEVKRTLERMREEAKETADRGERLAGELNGKKTAVLDKARETKAEANEMMRTYLRDHADGLEGLEFLIMAEAGELGHVEIVDKMNEQARDERIGELAQWALEVQRRHFEQSREAALKLAAQEDPNEPEA
jgi:imidazolonepropionase-like amidohydrolase